MDLAMHGEARESKEEQEGSKERAVSLPGNSLVTASNPQESGMFFPLWVS